MSMLYAVEELIYVDREGSPAKVKMDLSKDALGDIIDYESSRA